MEKFLKTSMDGFLKETFDKFVKETVKDFFKRNSGRNLERIANELSELIYVTRKAGIFFIKIIEFRKIFL